MIMQEPKRKALICLIAFLPFVLTSSLFAGTSLNGTVTTGDEKTAEAVVKLMNVKTQDFIMSNITDKSGAFQLNDVPDGVYKIGVSTEKGDYLLNDIVKIAQADTEREPLTIHLEQGDENPASGATSAQEEGFLSLKIKWKNDDEPVENAKIFLTDVYTRTVYKGSKTNDEGCSFVPKDMSKLPAGEYEVTVKFKGQSYPFSGTINTATAQEGKEAICLGIVEPDNVLVMMDGECECDVKAYILVPWWKTPIGIASIAGGVGLVGGIIIIANPTKTPSSPDR